MLGLVGWFWWSLFLGGLCGCLTLCFLFCRWFLCAWCSGNTLFAALQLTRDSPTFPQEADHSRSRCPSHRTLWSFCTSWTGQKDCFPLSNEPSRDFGSSAQSCLHGSHLNDSKPQRTCGRPSRHPCSVDLSARRLPSSSRRAKGKRAAQAEDSAKPAGTSSAWLSGSLSQGSYSSDKKRSRGTGQAGKWVCAWCNPLQE